MATPVGLEQQNEISDMNSRTYRKRPIELLAVSFKAPAPERTA
jgi:hypothetical protein